MNQVKEWLLLDPLDTLFFKGSEPMVAGENHEVRTVFPPMPATLLGAITTAILHQRQLDPALFTQEGGPPSDLIEKYPLLGIPGKPGFHLVGPLFRFSAPIQPDDWYLPAPAHWFADIPRPGKEHVQKINLKISDPLGETAARLGLCGSVPDPVWLHQPPSSSLKSLAGYWVNCTALKEMGEKSKTIFFYHSLDKPLKKPNLGKIKPSEPNMLPLRALFGNEFRVGIALEPLTRKVRTGHLYSSTQVRLQTGVAMVLGLSEKLCPHYLEPKGILQLGGEQRLVRYEALLKADFLSAGKSPWIMALSPFPVNSLKEYGWDSYPRVSGPLIRLAGWDMKKNFHKPVTTCLPAGTVIRTGVNIPVPDCFIRL